jgi:DNA (cytosine-5)-methyltransferase 3A
VSCCVAQRGRYTGDNGEAEQHFEPRSDGKTNAITTVQKDNLVAVPCAARQVGRRVGEDGKRHDYDERIEHFQRLEINEDHDKTNCLTSVQKDNLVVVPINDQDDKARTIKSQYAKTSIANLTYSASYGATMVVESWDGKTYPVYEVSKGLISIKGKQYPIKLPDGYYIIRKLTVTECMRLQTVPESYIFPVSNSQAYKMLGNGWTVDVIAHILSFIPELLVEEFEVIGMYDGMSCGHIALDKLGADIIRYYAVEIDKYAVQTTQANYPDTIQLGDAFQVRESNWSIRGWCSE